MKTKTLQLVLTAALLLANTWAWAGTDYTKKVADEFPSDVASTWFEQLYDVVKTEATAPPPASRIYGVTAVALYEAIVAGTEQHRSLVGQLNGLTSSPQLTRNKRYHWPTVANVVLARTIRGLYPTISRESLHAVTDLFGIKRFTDTTHTDHELATSVEPRTFDSFDSAAAAASRLYGGIHFSFDNEDGVAAGRCIGQAIYDRVSFEDDRVRRR